jgi:hypothetical protein
MKKSSLPSASFQESSLPPSSDTTTEPPGEASVMVSMGAWVHAIEARATATAMAKPDLFDISLLLIVDVFPFQPLKSDRP